MNRIFLTTDGEVLEETEWRLRATDRCFHCASQFHGPCAGSQDGRHEWVQLVNPTYRR